MDGPDVQMLPVTHGNKDGLLDRDKLARESSDEDEKEQGDEDWSSHTGLAAEEEKGGVGENPENETGKEEKDDAETEKKEVSEKDTDWFVIQGYEELGEKSGAKLQTRLLEIPLKRLSAIHPLSCCLATNRDMEELRRHHSCDQCGKRFKRKSDLGIHCILHTGEKPYCCDQCGKSFKAMRLLKQHHIVHTGERPYCCDQCGERFKTNALLKRHHTVHSGERPYCCDQCGKSFKTKSHLKDHHMVHTGEKPYCCDQCGKRFKAMKLLEQHHIVHTGERPYCCDQCGKNFKRKSELKRHHMVHTGGKPYCCDQCGERFKTNAHLKDHHMVHTGEKPYCCDQCGKRFKAMKLLEQHHIVHTGERPYCCDQCGKNFKRKSELKRHHMVHTGGKPYCCDQCGKSFKTKSHLRIHGMGHRGEKPYSCAQCWKSFKTMGELKQHHRVHTGEKPYCCDQCGERFMRKAELKKHHRQQRQPCKRAVRGYVSYSRTLRHTAREELESNREPSDYQMTVLPPEPLFMQCESAAKTEASPKEQLLEHEYLQRERSRELRVDEDSTSKLAAASPSSDIEVFDSFHGFLKAKKINYAHCPIFSAPEDEDKDIQTGDQNPRPPCETKSEPECDGELSTSDTEHSSDYSTSSPKYNYLTVSKRFYEKLPKSSLQVRLDDSADALQSHPLPESDSESGD